MSKVKTLGEMRTRTEFNPSNDSKVDRIKQKTAELINLLEDLRSVERNIGCSQPISYPASKETQRLINLAQDCYEAAALWAVKAATE